MSWYKDAVIYGVDVSVFQDSNGDGMGDFQGLARRIDYLAELGVTCLWVLPFYPSPRRDNGYDIMNYYGVDPRLGTLDDFLDFLHRAGERGIRVVLDLVMNHTSDQHPWFQAARRDSGSRYRDYYVWTESPPAIPLGVHNIFPGEETSVWTYDEVAGAYYYHLFYHFEPGLKLANAEVVEEIRRVLDFWLSFRVAGFRVDAASHMIEQKGLRSAKPSHPHGVIKALRKFVEQRRPGAVLLGEADVETPRLADFFGEGDELNMMFNFLLDNYLFLALARQQAEPIRRVLKELPAIPPYGQWANFLRNLDELDLERLTKEERHEVFAALATEESMQIFGRGIRRRLAPMLGGDGPRLRMAFSLLFSLPGTPVLVYGDEIGMGEDLLLPGRNAVRTPMQWDDTENAGFSSAPREQLKHPVVAEGPFAYRELNVARQQRESDSLLEWMRRLIALRRQCPELGWGACHLLDASDPAVLAHRCDYKETAVLAVHNLGDREQDVEVKTDSIADEPFEMLHGNAHPQHWKESSVQLRLPAYGHAWFRSWRGKATG